MENKTYDRIGFAIFLIFIGTFLILLNLGTITFLDLFNVLKLLLIYWPILIIIAGFKIIAQAFSHGKLFTLIIDFLFISSILAFLLISKGTNITFDLSRKDVVKINTVNEILAEEEEYDEKKYNFDLDAGEFSITDSLNDEITDSTEEKEIFLKSNGEYYAMASDLSWKYEVDENKTLNIRTNFKARPSFKLNIFENPFQNKLSFEILNNKEKIPTSIFLNLNASSLKANFQNTNLKMFKATMSAVDADLTFSKDSLPEEIEIDINAGNIDIFFPKDSAIFVDYSIKVGTLNIIKNDKTDEFDGLNVSGKYKSHEEISDDDNSVVKIHLDANVGTVNIHIDK